MPARGQGHARLGPPTRQRDITNHRGSVQLKFIVKSGLGVSALMAAQAFAQGMPLATTTGTEIGIQVSNYRYEEDNNGAFFMSLEGKKLGISAAITKVYENDWYLILDARHASGNTDYTSASTGSKSANPDAITEVRLTAGQDQAAGAQLWSPYAGLGYRYLNNDLRGYSTTGHSGYRRTSTYLYLPIGVTHRFRLGGNARFSTTFEYDYLIEGVQRSYMTDVPGSGYISDLRNLQRNGHGLRLNLAYETSSWSIGVFHHYWDIASSDRGVYTSATLVYTGIEPHNITRESGVQLKYRFH